MQDICQGGKIKADSGLRGPFCTTICRTERRPIHIRCVDAKRMRGLILATASWVWTPLYLQRNHAHAKRRRSCTLLPVCLQFVQNCEAAPTAKTLYKSVFFKVILADIAKIEFLFGLKCRKNSKEKLRFLIIDRSCQKPFLFLRMRVIDS